jgi:hypothetical protein
MINVLVHAYTPLILWTGLGAAISRILPQTFPRFLGRSLYWVGVPWQIFALARQTDFSANVGLTPVITICTLSTGIVLAWLVMQTLVWLKLQGKDEPSWAKVLEPWLPPLDRASQGTLTIAAMLGNTGFVGLGIIPALLTEGDMSWAVFFSVTQNLIGTYGIGVLLASYYGRSSEASSSWRLLRDVLTVPTLWAFAVGYTTQSVPFPAWADTIVDSSLLFVIPASFLLMGMRLSQLEGLTSLRAAAMPVVLKVLVLPTIMSLVITFLGITGEARLSLVLMTGMPCAFASLILSEEYDLNRDLAASSIALSTIAILLAIPFWLTLWG